MLNLIKLCVGIDRLEELVAYRQAQRDSLRKAGEPLMARHTTRMTPRRQEELLPGGSLFWVIKNTIQARQKIIDFEPNTGSDGIERCDICLDLEVIPTERQPRRAFQGWRYLTAEDAPPDIRATSGKGLPPSLRAELAELGLL